MPVHNADIAKIFAKVADLLEIQGANPFRVRAYRNAARQISSLSRSVRDMLEQNKSLTDLPGIGEDLAGKIETIVETGTLPLLQELMKQSAPELDELLRIPGLGPKRAQTLFKELHVTNLVELRGAAEKRKIRDLHGFGEKTEKQILQGLEQRTSEQRTKLAVVEEVAKSLTEYLDASNATKKIMVAGSYRRRKETVGDLDILVTCRQGSQEKVMTRFVEYDDVEQVVSQGKTRSTVILRSGLQVDLRAVAAVSYGAALHYFTGSKAHNIAVRKMGQKKNLKINEYGVFDNRDKRIAGKTEEEVYEKVDLPYIEPEMREDRGEIEAAKMGRLPQLITLDQILGDLHSHTKETDGRYSLEEMAEAAQKVGYKYLAVSNHSKHLTVARGLDAKRLAEQIEKIDALNEDFEDFLLLKAIEVDILEDGSLDLPDSILKELDLTVCAVHDKHNLPRGKQTERIIRAMDNRYFNILAHPTGRLINERRPCAVDMERLMDAARERGCFMELNAQPDRLDLNDIYCKMAKEMGVKIAISTDAHGVDDLQDMRFGVYQARRGWLEAEDVLNTKSWTELRKLFRRDN